MWVFFRPDEFNVVQRLATLMPSRQNDHSDLVELALAESHRYIQCQRKDPGAPLWPATHRSRVRRVDSPTSQGSVILA